jgi:hypothetical protein
MPGDETAAPETPHGASLQWGAGDLISFYTVNLRLPQASQNERIPFLQIREAREIAIGGPELGDSVGEAEGGDAGVMHFGAGNLPREKQSLEDRPVAGGLAQEYDARRSQESSHLLEGTRELRWRAVDLRMSGDGQEFMDARPGNSPWNIALDQRP